MNEEVEFGVREDPGIVRYFDDFTDIGKEWDDLFDRSNQLDLVINYGATWRNTYLKQLQALLSRDKARLRVVLPSSLPDSPLVKIQAERHQISPDDFRHLVEQAVTDLRALDRDQQRVFLYQATVAFHHALYLFSAGGVLALYALCGERIPTPAFLVEPGRLWSFLRSDFERLLRRSTPL